MSELWTESNLLIIAGSDTPATAIAGLLHYLTHYPRVLRILKMRLAQPSSVWMKLIIFPTKLASCTYLRAVTDETMRMSPSVTCTVPREVPKGGVIINGIHVPAGTVIGQASTQSVTILGISVMLSNTNQSNGVGPSRSASAQEVALGRIWRIWN